MRSFSCLALAVLVACSSGSGGGNSPPPSGEAMISNTAPRLPGPVVTVTSAGAEPRRALRYSPAKGARDRVQMVMRMAMTMGFGETNVPRVEMPPIAMTMDTVVTSATADRFVVAAKVTEVRVEEAPDPAVTAAVRKEVGAMVGMTMTMTMTRRGLLESADVKLPSGVSPQIAQMMESMKQSMSQVTPPFPEDPVGVGASWTAVSQLEANSLKLTQTAVFELVKLDGDRGTSKIEITQKALPQSVNPPGTPPGVKTHLESLATTGNGELSFDLGRVMPIDAKMQSSSAMQMSVSQQGQTTPMSMTMEIGMDLASTVAN
jgi:hypothetical protein